MADEPETADDDPSPADQAAIQADEVAQACADLDRQDILFLKCLPDLLPELYRTSRGTDNQRQQFAARRALTAICERIGRICRRDVPVNQALLD